MANLSFTSSGATPTSGNSTGINSTYGTNPISKALGAAQQPVYNPPPAIPQPSTPVKSTTINNPDGSSHVTTYHAPDSAFSGYLGGLGSTSAGGSPKAQGYIKQTAKYGAGNINIGRQAADIANNYGQQIADVGRAGAKFSSGLLTTGTSPVAQGNAAITAQTTAAQQQALAQGESAALQGTAQELTGQGQAANAANQAAGQSLTGQGLEQSGLTSAAQLAQPSPAAQGQTVFNPATGKFEGGSYETNLQTVVNAIKNGQIGYSAGVDSLSGLSPTAKADVLAALGPGFDTVASDAQASTRGTNIQTLGTAETAGQAQGITASAAAPGTTAAGQYGQIAQYKSAAQQGAQLASQLSDLIDKFGLNPSDINAVNAGFQKIAANTSDPRYQTLSNYLNDVASRYAQVLTPAGGNATDMTRSIAQSMINATAKGKSIQQVLAALDQQAQAVINAVPATGNVPGGNTEYKNGQTTSAGGYQFVFQNGKWVPK